MLEDDTRKLDELTKENEELRSTKSTLAQSFEDQTKQLTESSLKAVLVSKLESELSLIRQQDVVNCEKISQGETTIEALRSELSSVQKTLSEKEASLTTMEADKNILIGKQAAFKAQILSLEQTATAHTESISQLTAAKEELEAKVAQNSAEKESADEDQRLLTDSLDSLRHDYDKINEEYVQVSCYCANFR